MMIILGIDPGTAQTGYGIIKCTKNKACLVDYGAIKTTNKDTSSKRLEIIHLEILSLIRKHKPKVLSIESLFFNTNALSAAAVGQAIGVVKLAGEIKKLEVLDYPPLKIKMKVTGKGRADKKEIQEEVRKVLKLEKVPRPTHAADALAAAICHWKENGK